MWDTAISVFVGFVLFLCATSIGGDNIVEYQPLTSLETVKYIHIIHILFSILKDSDVNLFAAETVRGL
jgi:hypothetical protein